MPYDKKQLIDRKKLHDIHTEYAENINKATFDKVLDDSDVKSRYNRHYYRSLNMEDEVKQVVNKTKEQRLQQELYRQNQRMKEHGLQPFSRTEMEKVKNGAMKELQGEFKGATMDKRLEVSRKKINQRYRKEIPRATTEKGLKNAKKDTYKYMTDSRETGRSLRGGSSFKYNERLLISEQERANQEATKKLAEMKDLLMSWNLNPSHKIYDICDEHATTVGVEAQRYISKYEIQDVEMEGLYTSAEVPEYPHPYCQCMLDIVLTDNYGMNTVAIENIESGLGQNMADYNDYNMVSPESQKYIREWRERNYRYNKPWDYTRRSKQEKLKALEKIRDETDVGMEGVLNLHQGTKKRALEKYIEEGGIRGYQEVSKNILGYSLDADIIEDIGVDQAIKIMALDVKKNPNLDMEDVVSGLSKYIDDRMSIEMKKSLAEAKKHMESAYEKVKAVKDGSATRRAVMGMRRKAVQQARTELGDAVGYAEAHERLLRELRGAMEDPDSLKYVNIPQARRATNTVVDKLGVSAKNYTVDTLDGRKNIIVGYDGIEEITDKWSSNKGQLSITEKLNRIRQGKENKDGWLPNHMKSTYTKNGKEYDFKLRADQQTGIRFIRENKTGLIHYKPGAGKTHTAIGSISEAYDAGANKVLVVVPEDLVRQFSKEIDDFTDDAITVRDYKAYLSKKKRIEMYENDDSFVHVISHKMLKNDGDLKDIAYTKANSLADFGWDMTVVDEIHQITGKTARNLKKLDTEYKVGLTGTAVRDSVMDMYDTLDWLHPDGLPPKYKLEGKFKDITKASSLYEESVLRDLRDLLKPLSITRDSPVEARKIQRTIRAGLSEWQEQQLKIIEKEAQDRIDRGRMAVSKVRAIEKDKLNKVINAGGEKNGKLKVLDDLIDNKYKDEKKLIFSSDLDGVETLKNHLDEDRALIYTAKDLTDSERMKVIQEFKTNPDKDVLVLSDAGATGLNLQESDVTIHWDLPDKYYKLEQREARNWRGLKTGEVNAIKLKTRSSYDDRILNELNRTQKISDAPKKAEQIDELGVAQYLRDVTQGSE